MAAPDARPPPARVGGRPGSAPGTKYCQQGVHYQRESPIGSVGAVFSGLDAPLIPVAGRTPL
jgi:hypothetical protein